MTPHFSRPAVTTRARVIQGRFVGPRPQLVAPPHRLPAASSPGARTPVVQGRPAPAQRPGAAAGRIGHATELPEAVLSGFGRLPGRPLAEAVQRRMEELFATSFADVRVHVGPEAGAIGAFAFTLGHDLYFAPGQFDPHSSRGLQLLGHELAHVVQQREGRVINPFRTGVAVVQDPGLEAEAERMGLKAIRLPPSRFTPQAKPPAPPGSRPATGKSLQGAFLKDLFSGSTTPPRTTTSTGGGSGTPTPTSAHRSARRHSISSADQGFREYDRVVENERTYARDWTPLYHGVGRGAFSLHQLTSALWRVIREEDVPASYLFLRAPGSQVQPSVFRGPSAFIEDRVEPQRGWSDHQDRLSVLSVNLTLYGNVRAGGSEYTFDMVNSGGLFDVDRANAVRIIRQMLESEEMPSWLTNHVVAYVDKFYKKLERLHKSSGALYQIFVHNSRIPDVLYVSGVNGIPLNLDRESMVPRDRLQEAVGSDPTRLRAEDLTARVLGGARDESFWRRFRGERDPQARLLMRTDLFAQPNEHVRVQVFNYFSREVNALLDDICDKVRRLFEEAKEYLENQVVTLYQECQRNERAWFYLGEDVLPLEVLRRGSVSVLAMRASTMMSALEMARRR